MKISLNSHDALLVVDMQNDFLPGGSLAIDGADALLPVVNEYVDVFTEAQLPVFASRDWHPANHTSFLNQGGIWPPHCVAATPGADFHPLLRLPQDVRVLSKGVSPDAEAYSALDATGFDRQLRELGIRRVFVCGVATDYCVHASAHDLLMAGYDVVLLIDGVKAVDIKPGDGDRARKSLREAGALEITKAALSL